MALVFRRPSSLNPALPRRSSHGKKSQERSPPIVSLHFPASRETLPNKPLEEKFVISGGAPLSGHVNISGSKNATLALLAGTLCCRGTSVLRRFPHISDVATMLSVLRSMGAVVEVSDGEITVNTDGIRSVEPCSEAIGKMRAGFFVLGPLLARFGEAVVALPGGCNIGLRPIDLYLRGLRALGAMVELRNGKVHACAANGRCLVGNKFHLDYPSVGATETLIMAASMAEGVTVLTNAAKEPEVVNLVEFLTESGAKILGGGTSKVVIIGRKRLHGSEFLISPDRIEAGTYMVAAAITRSCISLSPVIPRHLKRFIAKLSEVGCEVTPKAPHVLTVSAVSPQTGSNLRRVHVRTAPFPGFPTDLQPQFMSLLTTCDGLSYIEEKIFEGRMSHVKELEKLGAKIVHSVNGIGSFVYGKQGSSLPQIFSSLQGTKVLATDLRGGASLILAGLAAEGVTEVAGISHVDRGYENLELKLQLLGANIRREPV